MLAYKVADRGGKLVEVAAAHTSQTCAFCGHADAGMMRLTGPSALHGGGDVRQPLPLSAVLKVGA